MGSTISAANVWTLLLKLVKYNMKVIFGNRFIWFVVAGHFFLLFYRHHQHIRQWHA